MFLPLNLIPLDKLVHRNGLKSDDFVLKFIYER